ncbi:MAG: ribosome-associated translation inhibitor RaiA [Candidatus Magasanikbacteria bacterium]|nr:ribosome-associated translation inhibitor RaiA [Candidatus Magasanikbacteria bacterium]
MQIQITGKGMELTEAIHEYVEKKITALDKFYDKIIRAHVIVGVENHHHLKGQIFICECKLEVTGNSLFASKNEKDLYKAVDKVRDYLEGEIKKHKILQREKNRKDKLKVRDNKEYQD